MATQLRTTSSLLCTATPSARTRRATRIWRAASRRSVPRSRPPPPVHTPAARAHGTRCAPARARLHMCVWRHPRCAPAGQPARVRSAASFSSTAAASDAWNASICRAAPRRRPQGSAPRAGPRCRAHPRPRPSPPVPRPASALSRAASRARRGPSAAPGHRLLGSGAAAATIPAGAPSPAPATITRSPRPTADVA